jgi:peroxiredoxin
MPANAENGSLKVGDKIPEFLGIDTDGDIVLTTEHHGKILVVSVRHQGKLGF